MLLRVQSYTSSVVPASDVIPSMMIIGVEYKQLIAIFWRQILILNGGSTRYIEAEYDNEVIPHGLCMGSVVQVGVDRRSCLPDYVLQSTTPDDIAGTKLL